MDRRTEAITISPTLFLKSVGIISLSFLNGNIKRYDKIILFLIQFKNEVLTKFFGKRKLAYSHGSSEFMCTSLDIPTSSPPLKKKQKKKKKKKKKPQKYKYLKQI